MGSGFFFLSKFIVRQVFNAMVEIAEMANSIGNKIVRELIDRKVVRSRYHLMRLMNVSSIDVVTAWYDGRYFNEARHLKRLVEVRDEWMALKAQRNLW